MKASEYIVSSSFYTFFQWELQRVGWADPTFFIFEVIMIVTLLFN